MGDGVWSVGEEVNGEQGAVNGELVDGLIGKKGDGCQGGRGSRSRANWGDEKHLLWD